MSGVGFGDVTDFASVTSGRALRLTAVTGVGGASEIVSGPLLDLDFTSGEIESGVTFARASTATNINSSGFVGAVGSNIPRFGYDPVTLAKQGLLIEGQRTNSIPFSQNFDEAAYWFPSTTITITSGAVQSPGGASNAARLFVNLAGTAFFYTDVIATSGDASYAIYAKASSGNLEANTFKVRNVTTSADLLKVTINYGTGEVTIVSGTGIAYSENAGNGWWRVYLLCRTGITSTNTLRFFAAFADDTEAVGRAAYIWGAQVELNDTASSYIPTSGTAATRAAEIVSMSGTSFTRWYSPLQGSFFVEYLSPTRTLRYVFTVGAGSFADLIGLNCNSINTTSTFLIRSGGSQVSANDNVTIGNFFRKTAISYGNLTASISSYSISSNGSTVATSSTAGYSVPSSFSSLTIGRRTDGVEWLFGYIKSIRYYPVRLPNDVLQVLSI